jgi:cytochrome c-type biogenesis protein CcsB
MGTDFLMAAVMLLYSLSTITYLAYLFLQKERLQQAGYFFLGSGFLFHTLLLVTMFVQLGHMPVSNLHETLKTMGWFSSGFFLILRFRYRLKILGVFAAPLTMFIMISSALTPEVYNDTSGVLKSIWVVVHVGFLFTGEAALALACGTGILYLLQESAIKSRRRGFFYKRLPSLDQLDKTGYACIVTGFAALTVGLIAGMVYSKIAWHRFASWDPKEIWAAISWVIYAALLHERITVGWRGRRSAILAIAGFVVLLFTFFGVNFFFDGHHSNFTR